MDAAFGIAVRWALVVDMMLLFGAPLFAIASVAGVGPKVISALRPLVLATAFGGMLLSVLGIAILAASMSGVPLAQVDAPSLVLLITQTAVGTAFLVRVVALLLAFALGLRLHSNRSTTKAVALFGAVALVSLAWSGHGVMDDGRTGVVHLVADIVHLLAAGMWFGALASLLWLLFRAGGKGPDNKLAHRALAGFASLGSASVALVLISGLINAWLLVGPRNILSLGASLYGQLLLFKLVLFAAMIALAAINRFRLTPSLGAAVTQGDVESVTCRLRLSLAMETFAAIAILGLVAWLGTLEPPVSTL